MELVQMVTHIRSVHDEVLLPNGSPVIRDADPRNYSFDHWQHVNDQFKQFLVEDIVPGKTAVYGYALDHPSITKWVYTEWQERA